MPDATHKPRALSWFVMRIVYALLPFAIFAATRRMVHTHAAEHQLGFLVSALVVLLVFIIWISATIVLLARRRHWLMWGIVEFLMPVLALTAAIFSRNDAANLVGVAWSAASFSLAFTRPRPSRSSSPSESY
ncbi:MAG TPA: hypothetical protein VF392_12080 [Terracidiphilus sp.]